MHRDTTVAIGRHNLPTVNNKKKKKDKNKLKKKKFDISFLL